MLKLKDLIECDYDLEITGITDNSKEVRKGYLFVATKGFNVDHFDFIDDAIKNGCDAVITDRDIEEDIPYIKVKNINDLYYKLCERFYGINLCDFSFVGITGTDGKTTTATITKELLNKFDKTTYIGTNGAVIDCEEFSVSNTTPCVSELYSILKEAKNKRSSNVVMEVSSEALLHERIKNFKYDIVAFTNITEDHLNVHKTLENYINCKKKLLNYLKDDGVAIVNGDDVNCKSITSKNLVTFGMNNDNDCIISNVNFLDNKTKFTISYLGNDYNIISPFEGLYNVYNVALAFLICLHHGLSPEYLVDEIGKLGIVSGRREKLDYGQDFEIIIDYAHTLNGIKNIIESMDKNKELIVITGCAGGREISKRKFIGKYILENSSKVIFTMDDPREESVDSIIDDMVSLSDKDYYRIIDRKEAIYKAFEIANYNSVVLILGKGRDNYMAIGKEKINYSDIDVIEAYFEN